MRRILIVVGFLSVVSAGCGPRPQTKIMGTGSTFVAPLMDKWGEAYHKSKGIDLDYEAVGSTAGVQRFEGGLFDLACTDAILPDALLDRTRKAGGDIVHIPLVVGAVAVVYNLPGLTDALTRDGPVLADVYRGAIKKWNDDRIQKLNEGVKLPDLIIHPIHRAEGSGTTFIWTDYLAKVSPAWKETNRVGAEIQWPEGVGEAKMGNAGVASKVAETEGAIGYVALTYALTKNLKMSSLKNREGEVVAPDSKSVEAAAAAARLPAETEDLLLTLTDAPGKKSYPICGVTWAIIHVKQPAEKGKELADFLRWATHEDGQKIAEDNHYGRLPKPLVDRLDKKLDMIAGGS